MEIVVHESSPIVPAKSSSAKKEKRKPLFREHSKSKDSKLSPSCSAPEINYRSRAESKEDNIFRELRISLLHVRNLPKGTKSVFLNTLCSNGMDFKTPSTWGGEKNVYFGRSVIFKDVSPSDVVTVRLMECKKKSAKCKASVDIIVGDFVTNKTAKDQFRLTLLNKTSNQKESLELELAYELREVFVLPLPFYRELIEILTEPNMVIPLLLDKVVSTTDDLKVAKHLVNILEYSGQSIVYFEKVINNEIENCEDSSTLFRGDNVGIEALDYYFNYTGKEYLKRTLKPHIERLVSGQYECELELRKLDKNADLLVNFDNFTREAQIIFDSIFDSINEVPSQFIYLLRHLQRIAIQKFPYKVEVSITAINGFLFLRFFVPALMNPQAFGIWDTSLDSHTLSILATLARSLQKMANMTFFSREREPHLHLVNDLLKINGRKLADFVGQIADSLIRKDELQDENNKVSKQNINVAIDVACIVPLLNSLKDNFQKIEKDKAYIAKLFQILKKINTEVTKATSSKSLKVSHSPVSSSTEDYYSQSKESKKSKKPFSKKS